MLNKYILMVMSSKKVKLKLIPLINKIKEILELTGLTGNNLIRHSSHLKFLYTRVFYILKIYFIRT